MGGRSSRDVSNRWQHTKLARREALQVGSIGLMGIGLNHLDGLRQASAVEGTEGQHKAKSCIFIFLSGGLAQHESFDMKPDAPEEIRGEFKPIATKTPGIEICEHLPMLAARSDRWALCRSLTHGSNEHSAGHHIMLTGRSELPAGFQPNKPTRVDYPSIASLAVGIGSEPPLGSQFLGRSAVGSTAAGGLGRRLLGSCGDASAVAVAA